MRTDDRPAGSVTLAAGQRPAGTARSSSDAGNGPTTIPHISVCVCTYKRPDLLSRTLAGLAAQDTAGRFSYSIVVADNDFLRSARPAVSAFAARSGVPTKYAVEPAQNIALARNAAVRASEGELVAFIDDDEVPPANWLLTMFLALKRWNADGILGPVVPQFDEPPPAWLARSGLWERRYPDGQLRDGSQGRTGNVLIKRQTLLSVEGPFRPEFLTGEDQDFFRRALGRGGRFFWCHDAGIGEVIPPARWTLRFITRRALHRGSVAPRREGFGAREVLRSVAAVPLYALAAAAALPFGKHRWATSLVKLCDHLGKLLAVAGFRPIGGPYVTE